eukprot:scaffold56177_cov18-Tisochrysis_lutea.AAC.2
MGRGALVNLLMHRASAARVILGGKKDCLGLYGRYRSMINDTLVNMHNWPTKCACLFHAGGIGAWCSMRIIRKMQARVSACKAVQWSGRAAYNLEEDVLINVIIN